jgi:hypothetical protein
MIAIMAVVAPAKDLDGELGRHHLSFAGSASLPSGTATTQLR